MLVRNKRGDWAGSMEEQFEALHGGRAPSREWRTQLASLGPLAATAEEANNERWPMAAGPVAEGTYQVISGARAEHYARETALLRVIFVLCVSLVARHGWIAKQLAMPAALADLGQYGTLLRPSVAAVCRTAFFARRCVVNDTPTYVADLTAAVAAAAPEPSVPDFEVWLQWVIATHAATIQTWPQLYCAAFLLELSAHGRRRRAEEPSLARVVSGWRSWSHDHPGVHLRRVAAPSASSLKHFRTWRPTINKKDGAMGKKGGTARFRWDSRAQLPPAGKNVVSEIFVVESGAVTITDLACPEGHVGRTTVIKEGEAAQLCLGLVCDLAWKDGTNFAKRYGYFDDAGEQVGSFAADAVSCDACEFHCEAEVYVGNRIGKGKPVDLCRICYLRLGPTEASTGFSFTRSSHGAAAPVTPAEEAAIAALKRFAAE